MLRAVMVPYNGAEVLRCFLNAFASQSNTTHLVNTLIRLSAGWISPINLWEIYRCAFFYSDYAGAHKDTDTRQHTQAHTHIHTHTEALFSSKTHFLQKQ